MLLLHSTLLRPLLRSLLTRSKRGTLLATSFAALCALQACSSTSPVNRFSYDFGPYNAANNSLPKTDKPVQFAINVADIDAPAIFEGNTMFYRLGYDNPQQLRPYAQQHWSMSPALLLSSRIKTQIAAAGGTVLAVSDGVANLPTLKIELEEFSQYFADASNNQVQLRFRASLVRNGKLLGQRHFNGSKASSSADAAGGAKAMQVLTDEAIADLVRWMQALDFK
ncbi:MAG: PqiC family protein [Burkholderiaceae bacterium]|nr:PqiC family protein [Burkholderiaceae bacterium]